MVLRYMEDEYLGHGFFNYLEKAAKCFATGTLHLNLYTPLKQGINFNHENDH